MTELRNTWALREVYFDEHGNPSMHREPVPMTDGQVVSEANKAFDTRTDIDDETLVNKYGHGVYISRFMDFARSIEAHHGITAQAKKETP